LDKRKGRRALRRRPSLAAAGSQVRFRCKFHGLSLTRIWLTNP
jgi:hypothetical protein